MNELSIVFDKMDIDTNEVLKAAGTKWNLLDFKPGLVGEHCIGVDPYYFIYLCSTDDLHDLDGIIFAVPHDEFDKFTLDNLRSMYKEDKKYL